MANAGKFILVAIAHFVVGIGLQVVGVLPSDGSLNSTTWIFFLPLYAWSFGLIGSGESRLRK